MSLNCLQLLPKNERKRVDLRFRIHSFVRLFFGRNVGLKKSFRLCLIFRLWTYSLANAYFMKWTKNINVSFYLFSKPTTWPNAKLSLKKIQQTRWIWWTVLPRSSLGPRPQRPHRFWCPRHPQIPRPFFKWSKKTLNTNFCLLFPPHPLCTMA